MIKRFRAFARQEEDTEEVSFKKLLILCIAVACSACGVIWAILYICIFGLGWIAFLPFSFTLIVGSCIFIAHYLRKYEILVYAQLICITWVSAFLQWSIGSIDKSGFVTAWSFLGPVGALIFLPLRKAIYWMVMFLIIIVISAIFQPALLGEISVSPSSRAIFYIMNIGIAGSVVFAAAGWFNINLQKEKKRSESLLLNILPEKVAAELMREGKVEPKYFESVTVLFTDIKDFTRISESVSAQEIVTEINICFSAFDEIISRYGIEKIKTIGDSYMAVGGLNLDQRSHASSAVGAGLEMQEFISRRCKELETNGKIGFEMRLGIHTGHIIAGVIGINKFQYDIWGDTVNTASRLETAGDINKVNISAATYELVKDQFICEHRGKLPVKGKDLMDMYFVTAKKYESDIQGQTTTNFAGIDFPGMEHTIKSKLKNELSTKCFYHNIQHTEDVFAAAIKIGGHKSINEFDMLLLKTAVLFHDSGFIIRAQGHEAIGCEFARNLLPEFGYSSDNIDKICGMIMATKIPQSPKTKLEQIICDADLDYLGRDDYPTISDNLYREISESHPMDPDEWLKVQIDFLEKHHFFTDYSISIRKAKKEERLALLKKKLTTNNS